MTTVFRIQDKEGRGPWRPGFSNVWVEDRPDHENLKPWTMEFPRIFLCPGAHYGCGCLTLAQLRRWFTWSEYSKLKARGYDAVTIGADRILGQSEIQCVFVRNKPLNQDVTVIDLYADPA